MTWHEILSNVIEKKINTLGKEPSNLSDLIFLQDNKVLPEEHEKSFKYVLDLAPSKILEIGCGNGSVLYLFDRIGCEVFGIDYVEKSIDIASKIMPKGKFKCSPANVIPFDEKFDLVLSNSVFQYFESMDYAKNVIEEVILKLNNGGKFIITDLPNADQEEDFKLFRMNEMGLNEQQWQKRYAEVSHLNYRYEDLKDYVESIGCKYSFKDPSNYLSKHQEFKFDIWITK